MTDTNSTFPNTYIQQKSVLVEGIDCSDCVLVIEHSLRRVPGVQAVTVDYRSQQVKVDFDSRQTSLKRIVQRLQSLGYRRILPAWLVWLQKNQALLLSLLSGILLLAGWAVTQISSEPGLIGLTLFIGAIVLGGWDIADHAWHDLRQRRVSTDGLMLLAALGAFLLGETAEGALLIFLFSFGHALEERLVERARTAIRSLTDLSSPEAVVIRNGQPVDVLVTEIGLQDTVLVRPGVRFPVDGVVQDGQSAVDESAVTGESLPVPKEAGDQVLAGTLNGAGALQVRATRLARDSTLARIVQMVQSAQSAQSPVQQSVERFMERFVPVVLAVVLLLILVPALLGLPFKESFMRAMVFLVAASPCALAIGPSSAVIAGISQAARKGVLIKGGVYLEKLGKLETIAFDKTGTLTQGNFKLERVIPVQGVSEAELLAVAGALEAHSGHPLAQAVVAAAREQGIPFPVPENVAEATGKGVLGRLDGQLIRVGSPHWVAEQSGQAGENIQAQILELQEDGYSVLVVMREAEFFGILALTSTPRPDAQRMIARLRQIGIKKQIMLSGDHPQVVRRLAQSLGLDDWRASLRPEQKLDLIKTLQAETGVVAMVGDGINDAPALAQADVGIAIGGAATDVALQTADVALMGTNLSHLVTAVHIGRSTQRVILQNLVLAITVMLILSFFALTGWVGVGLAVVLHETSTVLVVLNSLRLLGVSDPVPDHRAR